ncbi:UNVERIFIED_CONTAM: hypothetical protein Scaly_3064900, partial [Sesamum calycinum]
MEYWTTEGLSVVASGVGKPLYSDAVTKQCSRLDYARVCVMLDYNSTLPKHIVIISPILRDGKEVPVRVDIDYEWLPKRCKECQSLGHNAEFCPGSHKVAWENVCQPLNHGGLAIQIKTAYYLVIQWFRGIVVLEKILKLRNLVRKGVEFKVGDGNSIKLWLDPWLIDGPLATQYPRGPRITGLPINSWLNMVIDRDTWKWPAEFHTDIAEIISILPTIHSGRQNNIVWKNSSGKFSSADAYKLFTPPTTAVHWAPLFRGPFITPRHTFILWLAILGRLSTVDKPWCNSVEVYVQTHRSKAEVERNTEVEHVQQKEVDKGEKGISTELTKQGLKSKGESSKGKDIVLYNHFELLHNDNLEDTEDPICTAELNDTTTGPRGLNGVAHQRAVGQLVGEFNIKFLGLLETRVRVNNAPLVQKYTLPSWRWFVDYTESGSRIWLTWCDDEVQVEILAVNTQFIHCRVTNKRTHTKCLITVLYGENEVIKRRELWQGLIQLSRGITDEPWIVMGDFNAVLDDSEVNGYAADTSASMADFLECITESELTHLPFTGANFTWHNCSDGERSLWKRLDRMLVNEAWLVQWPNPNLIIMTKMPGFLRLVEEHWGQQIYGTDMYILARKLKAMKPIFRKFRKTHGDLHHNVQQAAHFLQKAQHLSQEFKHDSILLQLEKCCRMIY